MTKKEKREKRMYELSKREKIKQRNYEILKKQKIKQKNKIRNFLNKTTDSKIISKWAFYQTYKGNDTQEIRDLITDSIWAYRYCQLVRHRPDMWNKIRIEMLF